MKGIDFNNTFISSNAYRWPARSVEQLPPYSPKQLKYPVLVIGNTVRVSYRTNPPYPDGRDWDPQADPITPFASAQKTADLLRKNSFLLEQLGFGHSSLAQISTCTWGVIGNYVANSTVRFLCFVHVC